MLNFDCVGFASKKGRGIKSVFLLVSWLFSKKPLEQTRRRLFYLHDDCFGTVQKSKLFFLSGE